ncbi:MAG: hypothetical protein PHF86_07755 [Candidatus Nanoarchaeia archaeon]|jgi:hypothetical protein|nr:hypothetical protein [Candidatus Nanoarchaeia archaeon]
MLRIDQSNVVENALGLPKIKEASSYFERISFGSPKKDPLEGRVDDDVWRIVGNKLLRKKTTESKEE